MILPHKDLRAPGKWDFGLCGIVDEKGKFIKSSSVHYNTGGAYIPPEESIIKSSETAIYLFLLYLVWGHCLTDNIRRLWFLKSEYFNEFKDCPLVYISWGKQNLESQKNFRRLLEILEVPVDRLQEITQPTRFEKIILPDDSFCSPHNPDKGFTKEYLEAIEQVRTFALKHRTPTSNKKIYHFNGRKGVGENRIAEYFKSKGYDIVRPETLTFDEQINQLISCENFAGVSGSCAHNLLFLQDDTEMILIPRTTTEFNYYQEILNQVHPLNITYIDSSLSIFTEKIIVGNHFYIISEQLKKFFGDKWDGYAEEDLKAFLQYVKGNLNKTLEVNKNAMAYCEPILPDFMAQLKRREDLITACNMPPNWEEFKPQMPDGLSYQTHIAVRGWGTWSFEDSINGYPDEQLDIQAVKINFKGHKVYYSVYYDNTWTPEVSNEQQAGTTGQSKPIFGIRIFLDEASAKDFDILYRVHKFDGSWTAWAKNGEAIYSHGQKLNALQIKLEDKN